MMIQKIVLKLDFHDEKTKQKALQKVSRISGIESIAVDTKDKKLTIIGGIDPVSMVAKLRKLCHIEIVTVGPAKEPEKKKEEPKQDPAQLIKAYEAYYQQNPYYHQYQPYQQPPAAVPTPAYFMRSVEEDPNGCIIC